jgi:hypothetical protein
MAQKPGLITSNLRLLSKILKFEVMYHDFWDHFGSNLGGFLDHVLSKFSHLQLGKPIKNKVSPKDPITHRTLPLPRTIAQKILKNFYNFWK